MKYLRFTLFRFDINFEEQIVSRQNYLKYSKISTENRSFKFHFKFFFIFFAGLNIEIEMK